MQAYEGRKSMSSVTTANTYLSAKNNRHIQIGKEQGKYPNLVNFAGNKRPNIGMFDSPEMNSLKVPFDRSLSSGILSRKSVDPPKRESITLKVKG